jgi:hypothetical protein
VQRLADLYLASRRAHPVRWQFIDLVAGAAMVAVLCLLIGETVGVAFAVLWGVLMLLGLFVFAARRRHEA